MKALAKRMGVALLRGSVISLSWLLLAALHLAQIMLQASLVLSFTVLPIVLGISYFREAKTTTEAVLSLCLAGGGAVVACWLIVLGVRWMDWSWLGRKK